MYSNQLDLPLPDELGELPILTTLQLQDNKINGSIPYALGKVASPRSALFPPPHPTPPRPRRLLGAPPSPPHPHTPPTPHTHMRPPRGTPHGGVPPPPCCRWRRSATSICTTTR